MVDTVPSNPVLLMRSDPYLTRQGAYVTLGGVVPNPRLSKVREGIELVAEKMWIFFLP